MFSLTVMRYRRLCCYEPQRTVRMIDEKYLNVLKNMHRRLERWREETDEPLLEEPIMSPPKTTVVNDPDDLLPTSAMHPARDFMRI